MRRDLVSTPQPVDVDRVIYATITLMSVLIIYDGWQQLRFLAVVGAIVGPVLAMFLAHVFSASLAQQLSLGKPVTMKIVRSESRFLLLCVPPVLLVGVLVPLGVSMSEAIRSVLVPGKVSRSEPWPRSCRGSVWAWAQPSVRGSAPSRAISRAA
jgi:hypothetical protein